MDASCHRRRVSRAGLPGGLLFLILPLLAGASYRTENFVVEAPTSEIAQRVGDHAEVCRKSISKAWLGHELPRWARPCPIRVRLTGGEAGGVTSFGFRNGQVSDQEITVEGRIDRILVSALPHEITHTIFAAYFGGPMPRWADEGASLLSEDRRERDRHDGFVADLLERRGNLPLIRLFQTEEYPKDLMGFYGQGYSVSKFLVEIGGRPKFLQFIKHGMERDWDSAARQHYGLAGCRELERAWHSWYVVADRARPSTDEGPATVIVRAQSGDVGDPLALETR